MRKKRIGKLAALIFVMLLQSIVVLAAPGDKKWEFTAGDDLFLPLLLAKTALSTLEHLMVNSMP